MSAEPLLSLTKSKLISLCTTVQMPREDLHSRHNPQNRYGQDSAQGSCGECCLLLQTLGHHTLSPITSPIDSRRCPWMLSIPPPSPDRECRADLSFLVDFHQTKFAKEVEQSNGFKAKL